MEPVPKFDGDDDSRTSDTIAREDTVLKKDTSGHKESPSAQTAKTPAGDAAAPATIPKKLDEPQRMPDDTANKRSECLFQASTAKKASPFLTSKPVNADGSKQAGAPQDREVDSEVEKATAKKQHDKIDDMIKDRSIFNTIAKVYFKDTKTNKLENRGEGKFAIVRDSVGLYKVLMVRDKVMLLGCNHYIAKSCPLVRATQVPRSWIWIALNDKSDAEVNEPRTTYFVTFKTDEDFELFEKKYNEAREANARTVLELKRDEQKTEKEIL